MPISCQAFDLNRLVKVFVEPLNGPAPVRAYMEELMDEREALKVMVKV